MCIVINLAQSFPTSLRMANSQETHKSLSLKVISEEGPTHVFTPNIINCLTLSKINYTYNY